MLKKLCLVVVSLGLCFGTLGCGDKAAKMPENKAEKPAAGAKPAPLPTEAPTKLEE